MTASEISSTISHIYRKTGLLLAGLFLCSFCFSQDKDTIKQDQNPDQLAPIPAPASEIFYQASLQGGGGIIYPITNRALTESLQGVYYLHFSTHYVFFQHFYGGLEFEDSQLGITGTVSAYNTNMFTYSAGIKIGYYSYMQHDFLFSYSISSGYSYIKFSNTPDPAPSGGFYRMAPFITPNFIMGYRVNNELRIGLELSFLFNFYNFDPTYIGLNNYIDYGQNDAKGITTCFAWGFGVYYAFVEGRTLPSPKDK